MWQLKVASKCITFPSLPEARDLIRTVRTELGKGKSRALDLFMSAVWVLVCTVKKSYILRL